MSRPNAIPDWSTNTNYPPGADPWSSTPTRAQPSLGQTQAGLAPELPIPAEWMNFLWGNHGDWIKYLDALTGDTIGRAILLRDDFLGDKIDRGKWSPSSSNGIASLVDDSANGGSGALSLDARTAGTPWEQTLATRALAIAGRNWRMAIRARCPTYAAWVAGGASTWGLITKAGANSDAYFVVSTGNTIRFVINGAVFDTGVAPTPGAYQLLEMIQIGGTVTILVDGVQTNQMAYAPGGGRVALTLDGGGVAANDGSCLVDDATIYVERYSTTGSTLTPAPAHRERFDINVTPGAGAGHEYVDQAFAANFPDIDYDVSVILALADDLVTSPNVGFTIRLKAIGSLRIRFDAAFTGVVTLIVKDKNA